MDLACCDSILSWRNPACVNEEYSCRQCEIQSNKCQSWNRISDLCRESDVESPHAITALLEEGSGVLWSSGARLEVGGRRRVRDLSLSLGFFAAVCGLWAISPSPLCWSRRRKFWYFRESPDVRARYQNVENLSVLVVIRTHTGIIEKVGFFSGFWPPAYIKMPFSFLEMKPFENNLQNGEMWRLSFPFFCVWTWKMHAFENTDITARTWAISIMLELPLSWLPTRISTHVNPCILSLFFF